MKKELISIKFNKRIYNSKILKQAAAEYKDFASFKFSDSKDYIKVEIEKTNQEIKAIIKDEYCNYVLFTMIKNKAI